MTVLRLLGDSPVRGDCWWGVKKKVSSGLVPLLKHFLRVLRPMQLMSCCISSQCEMAQ